jgi:SH3 domain-containing YSC84-like protein 1
VLSLVGGHFVLSKHLDDSMGTLNEIAYSSLPTIQSSRNQGSALSNRIMGSSYPTQDYLYEPSFEPDFPEYSSREDPFASTQAGPYLREDSFASTQAGPKVNLKTVLGGLVSIVTGASKSDDDTQQQPSISTDVSFLESDKNGVVDVHPSVCFPSAPPLNENNETAELPCRRYRELLLTDPPEWLPDSSTNACMQCHSLFTALTRGRHHCRFCGSIFCKDCSKGRCLMPMKFRLHDPQRVCDVCYKKLEPLQGLFIYYNSNSMQQAKHDVMDWTSTRSWLNLPVGVSMEYEIYKAANTMKKYCQVCTISLPIK